MDAWNTDPYFLDYGPGALLNFPQVFELNSTVRSTASI